MNRRESLCALYCRDFLLLLSGKFTVRYAECRTVRFSFQSIQDGKAVKYRYTYYGNFWCFCSISTVNTPLQMIGNGVHHKLLIWYLMLEIRINFGFLFSGCRLMAHLIVLAFDYGSLFHIVGSISCLWSCYPQEK